MSEKLDKLRAAFDAREIEALLVSTPENRRYMSGFTGSAGYLLISRKDAVLATDFRYIEQSQQQAPDFSIERIAGSLAWLPDKMSEMGVRTIGFESDHMTVAIHSKMTKALEEGGSEATMVATTGIVEELRAVKTPEEIELLTRAVEIADAAMDRVGPTIEPGMTEEQVAWELEKTMRELGAEGPSFETIVGAGPNGALPHHRADGTVIKTGDPVVIDMGARYQGYCSDLTRTLFVGEPDDAFREIYNTVLRAQLEAEARVTAGMTGKETDAIARDIIVQAGHGDNFGHSLGHGIGLAVHESPGVGPNSDGTIEDGMVFTVEPGIYMPGWGGVRIEDMAVMENGRARVLSRARKLEV
jgi:Xaa-Pro aminopeptidase